MPARTRATSGGTAASGEPRYTTRRTVEGGSGSDDTGRRYRSTSAVPGSVGAMAAPEQYFTEQPQVPSAPSSVALALPDLHLRLTTDRGVFSGSRVDPGTHYLLLEAPMPPADTTATFLDLGCGYGPIALTLASRAPRATVWAVDVNERARDLTETNARQLGLANVRVAHPDEVPADLTLDGIYANPPIRVGNAALDAMLRRWLRHLTPTGRAHLVIGRNLGADSIARRLRADGWHVERLGSRAWYRILTVHGAEVAA